MQTYDVIRRTRDLLQNPDNWTQGTDARDESGTACEAHLSCAVQFCVTGAMKHVGANWDNRKAARLLLEQTAIYLGFDHFHVENFNDNQPHENVLKMLNQGLETIERLQAQLAPVIDLVEA